MQVKSQIVNISTQSQFVFHLKLFTHQTRFVYKFWVARSCVLYYELIYTPDNSKLPLRTRSECLREKNGISNFCSSTCKSFLTIAAHFQTFFRIQKSVARKGIPSRFLPYYWYILMYLLDMYLVCGEFNANNPIV